MINKLKKKGKKKQKQKTSNQNDLDHLSNPEFQAYIKLPQLTKNATHVFIVLDARNPLSCRFLKYEELVSSKLHFILNKIDLVPREVALSWYRAMKCVAPTFAICARESVDPILDFLSQQDPSEENKFRVLITGVDLTGKTTILTKLMNKKVENIVFQEGYSWKWCCPTADLVSIGASEMNQSAPCIINYAKDFLCRCSIHSLMDVFKIPFFHDATRILSVIHPSVKLASSDFLRGLVQQKYHYYTLPPASFIHQNNDDLDPIQLSMFKFSPPNDTIFHPFILLSCGSAITVKLSIVNIYQSTFASLLDSKKQKDVDS